MYGLLVTVGPEPGGVQVGSGVVVPAPYFSLLKSGPPPGSVSLDSVLLVAPLTGSATGARTSNILASVLVLPLVLACRATASATVVVTSVLVPVAPDGPSASAVATVAPPLTVSCNI